MAKSLLQHHCYCPVLLMRTMGKKMTVQHGHFLKSTWDIGIPPPNTRLWSPRGPLSPITPKINRATWLSLKFDRATWVRVTVTYGAQKDSDMGCGHFLNSTGDKRNFRQQRHATLPFLKINMPHKDPPSPTSRAPHPGPANSHAKGGTLFFF